MLRFYFRFHCVNDFFRTLFSILNETNGRWMAKREISNLLAECFNLLRPFSQCKLTGVLLFCFAFLPCNIFFLLWFCVCLVRCVEGVLKAWHSRQNPISCLFHKFSELMCVVLCCICFIQQYQENTWNIWLQVIARTPTPATQATTRTKFEAKPKEYCFGSSCSTTLM